MAFDRNQADNLKRTNVSIPNLRQGWALLRVRMAGICTTDLEILRGYHNFRGTPGHEFVGEVQEVSAVSAAVKKRWIGKRVAGEINVACRGLWLPAAVPISANVG